GPRLCGVYLLGSLAHGGFSRRYSDIDIGLFADGGVGDDAIAAMRAEAARLAPDLAPKLSLFWTDRSFAVGRFPPLDRLDYLEHAVALHERERLAPPRPTLAEVRAYLRGAPLDKWRAAAARLAGIEALEPAAHKPYLRSHLYPARFAYSWRPGLMSSNDDAIAWLHDHPPEGLDLDLLDRALQIRRAAADPDDLFPDRILLPHQVAACVRLAEEA